MKPNWFIALPVPADRFPPESLSDLPPGLARFHPDDLHVTLAFLGPVDASRALAAWCAATLLPMPDFRVGIVTARALGAPTRPSAYGLVVDDADGRLARYIDAHRDRLRLAAEVPAEDRPALPHVTLARPPRQGGAVIRQRAEQWLATYRPPAVDLHLDRLALYTRAHDRRQRRFRRVAEYPARPLSRAGRRE